MPRKTNAPLLDTGDRFPALELTLTDGRQLSLPAGFDRPYNVVLINRGAWCPFCVSQLKAFQTGLAKLAEESIAVISLSADPLDHALAMVVELGLQFSVAYGVSVDRVAEVLGVYHEPRSPDRPAHLHSAGFVVGPGGTVLLAVYSSGAIGRLMWQDVLALVKYVRSRT
jgi:peroxiredoxin